MSMNGTVSTAQLPLLLNVVALDDVVAAAGDHDAGAGRTEGRPNPTLGTLASLLSCTKLCRKIQRLPGAGRTDRAGRAHAVLGRRVVVVVLAVGRQRPVL